MELFVKRDVLSKELGLLHSLVDKKANIPILDTVRLVTDGQRVGMVATNLDITIHTELTADRVETQGGLCINLPKLFNIVKLMPEGMLQLNTEENGWIRVSNQGTRYRIPGFDVDQYPTISDNKDLDIDWLEVPAKHLKNIVDGVDFAIAPEEDSQYLLKAAKLEIEGNEMRMVATDGHRVCLAVGTLKALLMDDLDVVVPAKAITELGRLVTDFDGDVGVGSDDNHIYFRVGPRLLAARRLSGEYPAYQMVIATTDGYEDFATFKASDLGQSIRRTMVIADGSKLAGVALDFREPAEEGKKGTLHMDAREADAGEINEVLESDYTGGNVKVWVNGKFLREFLDVLGTEKARVSLQDADRPVLVTGKREGIDYTYVLMTLRVPE